MKKSMLLKKKMYALEFPNNSRHLGGIKWLILKSLNISLIPF